MYPNILLIVLDSVRARNTSLHGYKRDTTPFISDFGGKNIVFNQARAPSVASLPSHISIFTGLHTEEHKFGNDDHRKYKLAEGTTIWENLNSNYNFNTGVFSTNPYLTTLPVGIRSKFDTVVSSKRPPYYNALDPRDYYDDNNSGISTRNWLVDSMSSGKPVRSLINAISMKMNSDNNQSKLPSQFQPMELHTIFLNWIDELDNAPWASCINLMDAHAPYTPSTTHDKWSNDTDWEFQEKVEHFRWEFVGGKHSISDLESLENLYDGAILEADNKVKNIILGLQERGILDETLVIVTSDHGEGFGEKSNIRSDQLAVSHTVGLHESQVHVPLVVHLPSCVSSNNENITELASLTQFPSVVEATIEKNNDPQEMFVTKNGLITAQPAIGKRGRDLAESYEVPVRGISGPIRAVYQQESNNIFKYMSWKNNYIKLDIIGNTVLNCDDSEIKKEIEDKIGDMCEKEIKISQYEELDQTTENRLSDLGYV